MNQDFRDLLHALSESHAEFLVVGAYALAVHGIPRATGDIDIWVRPAPSNAQLVMRALETFGAPLGDLTLVDLATPGIVFQIGLPPRRIDIMTRISGVDFDMAWKNRKVARFGDIDAFVIGLEELIANKAATGRPKDVLDHQALVTRSKR
jgi:hypothetical protein